jgi:hypothetical protein
MASLITDRNGLRRIEFSWGGKPRTLRLGRMPKAQAQSVKHHIEVLIGSKLAGAIPPATAQWLGELPYAAGGPRPCSSSHTP